MSEQKIRRKTFIATLGASALGWVGLRADTRSRTPAPATAASVSDGRVVKAPRSIPCAGRIL